PVGERAARCASSKCISWGARGHHGTQTAAPNVSLSPPGDWRMRHNLPVKMTPLFLFCVSVLQGQSVVTIAGTGSAGFAGDGGPGVKAEVNNPYGLTVGPDGALYFCEIGNHRIRRLDRKSGEISTVAGSGQKGYAGDGGPALAASLNEPYEVRFDSNG